MTREKNDEKEEKKMLKMRSNNKNFKVHTTNRKIAIEREQKSAHERTKNVMRKCSKFTHISGTIQLINVDLSLSQPFL